MFAFAFHLALLAGLFLVMGLGGVLSFAGLYAVRVDKGRTRAARLLNAGCWLMALVGILLFAFAASHFVPLVMA